MLFPQLLEQYKPKITDTPKRWLPAAMAHALVSGYNRAIATSLPMSWLGGGIGVSKATRSGVRTRLAPEAWAAVGVRHGATRRTAYGSHPEINGTPQSTTELPLSEKGKDVCATFGTVKLGPSFFWWPLIFKCFCGWGLGMVVLGCRFLSCHPLSPPSCPLEVEIGASPDSYCIACVALRQASEQD